MEQKKVEFARVHRVEEADIRESLERLRQQPRADVEQANLHLAGRERVQYFHLIGRLCDVDDARDVGMEALQRAAGEFGVEGARQRVFRRKIVEHCARDRRFAHAAFIGADDENRWLHFSLQNARPTPCWIRGWPRWRPMNPVPPNRGSGRYYPLTLAQRAQSVCFRQVFQGPAPSASERRRARVNPRLAGHFSCALGTSPPKPPLTASPRCVEGGIGGAGEDFRVHLPLTCQGRPVLYGRARFAHFRRIRCKNPCLVSIFRGGLRLPWTSPPRRTSARSSS